MVTFTSGVKGEPSCLLFPKNHFCTIHIVVYVHILLFYTAFYAKNKNDKSVYTKA